MSISHPFIQLNMPANKLILGLACFVFTLQASAQWNDDPTVNTIVCNTPSTLQFKPQLVADESGGVLSAWMEMNNTQTASNIFAQRLSSSGTRLWGTGGINVSGSNSLYSDPQIVSDGNGGAIVSWVITENLAVRYYMQKINSNGQLQWAPEGVLVCPTMVTPAPFYKLIPDNQGGAILIWDDTRAGFNQIYAQRINSNGNRAWPVDGLPCSNNFANLFDHEAVADSTGGFFLCYSMVTGGLNNNDIIAQHIDSGGNLTWGSFGLILSGVPRDQLHAEIIRDSLDNVIIVWQDFIKDPVFSQLYGQRISSAGDLQWGLMGKKLVDSVVPASAWQRLAADTSRGVIITWLDDYHPTNSDTAHLFGIRFDSTGNVVWEKKELASWADLQTPTQYLMTADFRGGAYMTWLSPFSGSTQMDHYDLYAQHVLPGGGTEFRLSGKTVSSVNGQKFLQQLTCDSNGMAVVAWMDQRALTDYDIYASRIVAGGSLPVNWVNFSGTRNGNSVMLSWQTDNEVNNKGFNVQRSYSGAGFTNIGFVAASDLNNYSYADNNPGAGSNYYRLQQQDIDGKLSYSRTIRIDFETGNKLRISPNPASGVIAVSGLRAGSIVQIYSADGKKYEQMVSRGTILEVNTYKFPKGIYYVRIGTQTLPVLIK